MLTTLIIPHFSFASSSCWSGCSIIRVVPARERLARTANTSPFVLQQSIIVLELCNITLVRAWVNPIERGKFAYNREEVASAIRCHGPHGDKNSWRFEGTVRQVTASHRHQQQSSSTARSTHTSKRRSA